MRVVVIALFAALLSGCAMTKEVLVPVYAEAPEPPIIKQPTLPIWSLTEEDDANPDDVVRAYVKSLYMQRAHSDQLQCALDAYRLTTEKQCPEDE